jgi:hypothetical protein
VWRLRVWQDFKPSGAFSSSNSQSLHTTQVSDFLKIQFLQVESYTSRGRPDRCRKSLHNPVTNIVHQFRPQCGSWWVVQMLDILRSVELVCWTLVSLMHTSRNIMLEMPPCFSRWKLRWLLLLQSCVIPVKWLKPSTNSVTIQELGKVWWHHSFVSEHAETLQEIWHGHSNQRCVLLDSLLFLWKALEELLAALITKQETNSSSKKPPVRSLVKCSCMGCGETWNGQAAIPVVLLLRVFQKWLLQGTVFCIINGEGLTIIPPNRPARLCYALSQGAGEDSTVPSFASCTWCNPPVSQQLCNIAFWKSIVSYTYLQVQIQFHVIWGTNFIQIIVYRLDHYIARIMLALCPIYWLGP